MNDYKIVIDPGHGGVDSGANGNGIIEKDLTLEISKYMFDRFKELGIPVSITRVDDVTLSPTDRVNKILGFYGNNPEVIVISNHINAGGGDGAEVIYALRNNDQLSNLILSELQKEGQNARKVFQRRLPSDMNKDYYFIHRNTGVTEPVIVEYGFLDSSKDDVYQLKNNYESYAEAVVRAVLEYIGVDYLPVTDSNIYVVRKGDTLWSIAKRYNMSVTDLKKLNNLTSNLLSVGQTIKVNDDNIYNNDIYVVKRGDTLYGIANKYGVDVNELKNYNNLVGDSLIIGQEIFIPKGQIVEDIVGTNYDTYIVKRGDTLYGIANQFGINIDDIRNLNNLSTDVLAIGQKILIPSSSGVIDTEITNYIDYRIVAGDTLYGLSNRYGVSVDKLKKINNLTNNNLSIGQVIKVPYFETKVYTVKIGDTLYSIANRYGLTVNELKEINNLTNDNLLVGQILNVGR